MKSFLYSFKRYKVSFLLNVLSLSIAFATFYILMVQVNFEWGFDSFHKDADRIYRLEQEFAGKKSPVFVFPRLHQLIESSPNIEAAGIKTYERNGSIVHAGENRTDTISARFCYITQGYAQVFTFDMIEGSVDSIRDPRMAILPLSLAQKIYGERKSYIGEEIGDGQSWTLRIGGVYRDFPKNSMLQNVVYQIPDEARMNAFLNNWTEGNFYGYLKLKKGADSDHLFDDVKINRQDGAESSVSSLSLRPLEDIYYCEVQTGDISFRGVKSVTWLLFSIAVLVVFIAGINFMNFSIALVPSKIKNINTRMILGASATRLRGALILESVLLSFLSFLISLFIVFLISRTTFASYLDGDMSLPYQGGLIVVLLITALFTGLFSSAYPAYYITSFTPAMIVKGTFALSRQGRILRNGLIGLQFTASLIVVAVVIFMSLQNQFLLNGPMGFDKDQILNVSLDRDIRLHKSGAFVSKLKEHPFIEDAAVIEQAIGEYDGFMEWGRNTGKGEHLSFSVLPVSYNYLDVLGIKVSEGRNFRREDMSGRLGVFIFNETAKKKYNLELGETIESSGEIIGFIPDIKFKSFRNAVEPMAFYVWGTENWGVRDFTATVRVKPGADIYDTMRYIKQVCSELSPSSNFDSAVKPFDEMLGRLYEREQRQNILVSIFSLLVIFISVVGVCGLVIFETQARRREIGVCKVFGSSEMQILYLLNKTYIRIVLVCAVIAVPVAYRMIDFWLQSFAYHIPIYLWVFVIALMIVLITVSATVTVLSWRTARENPVDALNS